MATIASYSFNNNVAGELIDKPDEECDGILNPFNKKNVMITTNKIQNILKKYGIYHNIYNEKLYQEAMIHESYSIPKINEVCARDSVKVVKNPDGCILLQPASYDRLEFLGDAIIELVVVNYLYKRYPDQSEGFLSMMKVHLVNRMTLSHLTKVLELDNYLIISRTLEEMQNARQDVKILCDIFESFIGALFIDFDTVNGNGYQVVERFMISLIEDENSKIDFTEFVLNDTNYKDKLIKYHRNINKFIPTFNVISTSGIGSDKVVEVEVVHPKTSEILGKGKGISNKKAEQAASKNALLKLGLLSR
jgi:ribonuclease III